MAVSILTQHRAVIIVRCSWHEGKQIKALCQGPRYGGSLDEKINDVKKHSASVQCCIDRLSREAIARTESKTEQTVHLATDIKANTRKIEEDSAVSRTGIARIEITQTTITDMIHKMQKNVETVLQEDFRNKECKIHRFTAYTQTVPTRRKI